MKKYLISGFNTVQDVKLEVGTYTLVAYVKSMHGDVYTFALGDGIDWEEFSIDVIQGQLCKVWLTFTIDKKATKFKPIANNFTEELPVYVADLQLTRGNIPVESGASPFDIDQILNDLHDEIDAIEDFTEGAFLDGLLSREEKTQLRASLDSIGSIVESVKGSYDKLLDNPFIHENTMDSITARYYAFIASWISDGDPRGLKPVILWIVNGDNIVDQNERDEKDRALNAFNDALYAYNQAEKEVYNDVGENSIAPIIINGMWAFWSTELQEFIPSEFSAEGDDGHSPYIDVLTGTWWEWNPEIGEFKDTFIKAEGEDGKDGVDGEDAVAPIIIDGFWAFWNKETETFIPSEFSAIGDDGHVPEIRDGYWYEWNPALEGEDKYQNTNVRAEGIKGDGAIEKFKSSATQPPTPTGEAEDWDDEPTASQHTTLVPVGNNLYDRNYLIQRGWTNYSGYVSKNLTSAGENLINPSLLKPNKQYILKGRIDGDSAGSFLDINYTTGSKKTIYIFPGTVINETTDKDRSVASIVVRQFFVIVFDGVTLFELDMGEVKNLPIWATRKTIKNGVESTWSTPVKWSGEDGEKGKDGTGINVVGSADTWNSLPTSGNNLNDARIVQDTGVLAVWDGTKWVGAGEIKGPAGDTPYIGGNGNWWIGGTDTGVKAKGDKGDTGDGIRILGSKDTPSELSEVSNPVLGDGYLINGDLWVYDGVSNQPPAPFGWGNAGRIKGEKGKDGSSYLVLGYWSPDYEYQQSDAGIPVVKRPGSATFQAYKLIVPISTQGHFYNSSDDPRIEWELVDSSEFTYMLEAYIEVLQAELITAEKIEALDIVHPSGKYSLIDGKLKVQEAEIEGKVTATSGDVGQFAIENGELVASHSWFTYVESNYVQVTSNIRLTSAGVTIHSSFGGTVDHPPVVSWDTELTSVGLKVGSVEIKRDGIYIDGVKKL